LNNRNLRSETPVFLFPVNYDQFNRCLNIIFMADTYEALKARNSDELKWVDLVIQHVGSLRYGVVEIVVHDSRVIQIEKTERVRLEKTTNEKRA